MRIRQVSEKNRFLFGSMESEPGTLYCVRPETRGALLVLKTVTAGTS